MSISVWLPIKNSKGLLHKTWDRPENLPRVGESIYIMPNFSLKVKEISYDGPNFNVMSLTLEPIASDYVEHLIAGKPLIKSVSGWNYYNPETKSTIFPN